MTSDIQRPKRLVTLRRDDDDFVVAFYPDDTIAFRHADPNALRKVCAGLRWKIISDGASADYGTLAVFEAERQLLVSAFSPVSAGGQDFRLFAPDDNARPRLV